MDDLDAIMEIEAVMQLKARYCRLLDTKDWGAWRELFADDFVSDTSEAGGKRVEGRDSFVTYTRKKLGKPSQTTVHHVHAPELALTSPTTARGIWAMEDFVRFAPAFKLHGYGHYHETYEKVAGQWRFKTSTLTRVREDVLTPLGTFQLTSGLKGALARVVARFGD